MKRSVIIVFTLLLLGKTLSAQTHYQNPILAGFYPDPSICRVGNDYYIVTSSFAYFPGLPIFHSTDLVNWKQIGHALNRNEQLDLSNAGVSRGLFAPTIRYHEGTFYIIGTLIDKGGNFIITAKDPKGPWSNPIWLPEVNGIDPSLFFEGDKTYITYNSIPPDNKTLYDGHRTIRQVEFNREKMKVISENTILVNGGVDIAKKPVWIEAPHIYKKDDWYYLLCAEGGTAYNHSEVVFRSKNVNGPFIPFDKNPILTQRHLSVDRKYPVTTAGHADLVETPEGKWYAVFLACRPYDTFYYNIGRETFLTPVEWNNGWPIINPGFEEIQYHYPVPLSTTNKVENNFSGNFYWRDEFDKDKLNDRYVFLRNPEADLFSLENKKLSLPLKQTTVAEKKNPAFIGFRQSHHECYAASRIHFKAVSENEKAGMVVFQNEHHYYFMVVSIKNNKSVIELYQSGANNDPDKLLASLPVDFADAIDLKIEASDKGYSFYYAITKDNWQPLELNLDRKWLSTQKAGGFVGTMFGLYATSNGMNTTNKMLIEWFEYKGNDSVFNRQ